MISGHFPSTYGHEWNWVVLLGLSLISVAVRHYFNTRHNSQQFLWALPAAVLALLVMAYVTVPHVPGASAKNTASESTTVIASVTAEQTHAIVETHCAACHSATPSHVAFSTAPAGLIFDSIDDIKRYKDRIYIQSVASHIMPLGNSTGMTQDERDLLGLWIIQGANVK
jgi:uncharacterized membrane protein